MHGCHSNWKPTKREVTIRWYCDLHMMLGNHLFGTWPRGTRSPKMDLVSECAYLSLCLFVWLLNYSIIHPSIHSSIHLFIHPFIHPSLHPSLHSWPSYLSVLTKFTSILLTQSLSSRMPALLHTMLSPPCSLTIFVKCSNSWSIHKIQINKSNQTWLYYS